MSKPSVDYDSKIAEELFPHLFRYRIHKNPVMVSPIDDASGIYYRVFKKGNRVAVLYVLHFDGQDFPPHPWDYEPIIVFAKKKGDRYDVEFILFDDIHYKIGYVGKKELKKRGYALVMKGRWRSFDPIKLKEWGSVLEYRDMVGLDTKYSWRDMTEDQRTVYAILRRRMFLPKDRMMEALMVMKDWKDGRITSEEFFQKMTDLIMVRTGNSEVPLSSMTDAVKILGDKGMKYLVYNFLSPVEEVSPETLGGFRPLTDEVIEKWQSRPQNPFYIREGWLEDPWEQNRKREKTWNGDPIGEVISIVKETLDKVNSIIEKRKRNKRKKKVIVM